MTDKKNIDIRFSTNEAPKRPNPGKIEFIPGGEENETSEHPSRTNDGDIETVSSS